MNNTLTTTSLRLGKKIEGKVRDVYELDEKHLLIVTTDRISAFDRVLACVPYKGQVLNLVSVWWFEKTRNIIKNHLTQTIDPNAILAKKCVVFPIEFVVRGFITGTTGTSMWLNYEKGVRDYCGHVLPEGLKKNQRLEKNLVTPTTKEEKHDSLISPTEIIKGGRMTEEDWKYCEKKALELFAFGQEEALKRGLLLVDTKYEMGKDEDGNIILIDEIHTPDSSRYWLADSYQSRFDNNQEPDRIDKDILRTWYSKNCDPYKDTTVPEAPKDLIEEVSKRYIMLYEKITGEKFQYPATDCSLHSRLEDNISKCSSLSRYKKD